MTKVDKLLNESGINDREMRKAARAFMRPVVPEMDWKGPMADGILRMIIYAFKEGYMAALEK